jgi:hypothetical protein
VFETLVRSPPTTALTDASVALAELPLSGCGDGELLDLLREAEAVRRRLAYLDQRLIAEILERGIAPQFGFASVRALLRDVLRVSPSEASARVKAAQVAGPRHALDGTDLEPVLPMVAAAQADGVISAAHLAVIADTVHRIPLTLQAEHAAPVEATLAAAAGQYDPATLARLARRILDHLDPDGTLADDTHIARLRELTVTQRPNGSSTIRGEADADLTERLLVVFDSLAAPATVDGVRDDRSAGQRRHDALRSALRLVERSRELPDAGGMPATVLLTATLDQWNTDTGLVSTSHGATLTVATAKRLAGVEAGYVPVVLGPARQVSAYGSTQRIFTTRQRRAIMARDRGCTWPGCDAPPAWCEINHVIPFKDDGDTSVANGAAICDRDHDNLDHNGWTATMINAIPHYIPPPWIDPHQTPRRNTLHDV